MCLPPCQLRPICFSCPGMEYWLRLHEGLQALLITTENIPCVVYCCLPCHFVVTELLPQSLLPESERSWMQMRHWRSSKSTEELMPHLEKGGGILFSFPLFFFPTKELVAMSKSKGQEGSSGLFFLHWLRRKWPWPCSPSHPHPKSPSAQTHSLYFAFSLLHKPGRFSRQLLSNGIVDEHLRGRMGCMSPNAVAEIL